MLFFINSLTWSYFVFILTYIIIGKVFLPSQLKAQWLRSQLSGKGQ